MNTDSPIPEKNEVQSSRFTQKECEVLETVETEVTEKLMDTVTVAMEAFSEECHAESLNNDPENISPDYMASEFSEMEENNLCQGESLITEKTILQGEEMNQVCDETVNQAQENSDFDNIPETILMKAVEEIANSNDTDNAHEQTLLEETTNSDENRIRADTHLIDQVGQLTRNLHNSLRELGYDKRLESIAAEVPEAQDKLSYVATKTEQAAERTLNATEVAMPIQEKLSSEATQLSEKWKSAFEEQRSQPDTEKFKLLLIETLSYIDKVPAQTDATNAQLMEIMMAQDFQDLTGQVIKKVTTMVQRLEHDLLQLLLANVPPEKRQVSSIENTSLMNGPVTNPEKSPDTLSNQDQVDDLLASLGF